MRDLVAKQPRNFFVISPLHIHLPRNKDVTITPTNTTLMKSQQVPLQDHLRTCQLNVRRADRRRKNGDRRSTLAGGEAFGAMEITVRPERWKARVDKS